MKRGLGHVGISLFLLAALSLPQMALSATPLNVEVYRGSIIGSSRIIGMGGAYTPIAEGIEGFLFNPASLSVRPRHSMDWLSVDFNLDWFLSPGGETDFDNDGTGVSASTSLGTIAFALGFQIGYFAVGLNLQIYPLKLKNKLGGATTLDASEIYVGTSYALFRGQLALGVGVGSVNLTFNATDQTYSDANIGGWTSGRYAGLSLRFGALWRPRARPYRVGVNVVLPGEAAVKEGQAIPLQGLTRPELAIMPWRLSMGFSFMHAFGGTGYNHPIPGIAGWCQPDRPFDQRYILASVQLELVGATSGTSSMESYGSGQPHPLAGVISVVLRLGVESELVHNRLRLRLGMYNEPDRSRESTGAFVGRIHGTASVEARLFSLLGEDIKAGAGFDLANRYANILITVGFWR